MILRYDEQSLKDCPFTCMFEHLDPMPCVNTYWEITYPIYSQEVTIFVNEKKLSIRNDAFIVMKPGDLHYYKKYLPERYVNHRSVFIDDKKMKKLCASIDKGLYESLVFSPEPLVVPFGAMTTESFEKRWEIFARRDIDEKKLDSIHSTLVACYLGLYLENQITKEEGYPMWLANLLNNLTTPEFASKSISEIVESTNYSHGFICREFRKYFGKPLVRFILEERLRKSLLLLMNKDKSAIEIAFECGFCSQSSYINAFKKLFKVTPAVWRKNYLAGKELWENRTFGF